ncbi:MAG: ATP-binding protein [Clostridia bacterium]|nr:ATP-binding protein [Clostridia bacterium]
MKNRKPTKKELWQASLSVGICLVIVACLFGFFRCYRALNESLRDERAVYVNELTEQLTRSITAKREWLSSRIGSSASAFEQSSVASFAEAHKLFAYKENENYTVLLADDAGSTYTLDGKTAQIRNFDILTATLASEGAQYHFDKSADGVDYWVFSSALTPRLVDGVTIVALYEIYDVVQFHDDLYLGLFGDDGYTYLVDLNGGIQLGPRIDVPFIGYNLITSLKKAGIDAPLAEKIERDIRQKNGGSLFASFDGTDWAVQYQPLADSDEMAVVIAPIASTSQETTAALQNTLLAIAGVVLGLAFLVLSIIIVNAQASKERDRQMYELELKNRVASTKNNFLAKMSHDIRTPLNAIIGMNYIATTQVEEDAPVMDNLKQIDISAKYLLGILNDILDMSKIESGKVELRCDVFDGHEIINTITAVSRKQATEKDVRLDIHTDSAMSRYYVGDKQRLSQILMNLINNAIKFTDSGGSIDVSFALLERLESRDRIRLVVADTGIGMNDAFMEKLFTPFTQDASGVGGGSGLGLSIVKSFVDMMGGTISAKSKKGEGSTFEVVLELARAEAPASVTVQSATPPDESAFVNKRVLLVEDNDINLLIAAKIIARFGPLVETATNGMAALMKYTETAPGYYDAIVTDIQMPEMNGYEFADAVRALDRPDAKTIPILAMSANAFDDDMRKSLQHGMNAHLKKPIEMDEFKATLLKYLGGGDK